MKEQIATVVSPDSQPRAGDGRIFPKTALPITTRLALEVPKPKDWQMFQRCCAILYRFELNDPHVQEYGRSGQKQNGIDILGRRDGNNTHFVGIQCRHVAKPLEQREMLKDARAALALKADLKELIFATTAPDDTKATDAAIEITETLRREGLDISVFVYGWGQLQNVIALHETAYNAFNPSAMASTAQQNTAQNDQLEQLTRVVAGLAEKFGGVLPSIPPEDPSGADEDPALHARIDTYRELLRDDHQPLLAKSGLLSLAEKTDLSNKPWARYRIQANLGAAALSLGQYSEAIAAFETAFEIRKDDPNALANLALARILQARFAEAMELAGQALAGIPRADYAVGYLLQAAARSDWGGDPESLIPADLVGSFHADLGICEFLRRRDTSDWPARTIEITRRHPNCVEFKTTRALAVLSLAIEIASIVPGGFAPFTAAELRDATDDMKSFAEHLLDLNYADISDLAAHINNAAALLRLSERHGECEALLLRGMPRVGDQPHLRRLLALARFVLERNADAVEALDGDTDPENRILRAQLLSISGEVSNALSDLFDLSADDLEPRLKVLRWQVIGDLALKAGDFVKVQAAVAGEREIDAGSVSASILELRAERQQRALEETDINSRLLALAGTLKTDVAMSSRYFLAVELRDANMPEEASRLLEGHADLSRPSPLTDLLLQTLASSRRDAVFEAMLATASLEVRSHPSTLWTIAAHAWNCGNMAAAKNAVEALLAKVPKDARAHLLKIEILIREDRLTELLAELDKPLEGLAWRDPSDRLRLAGLLGHFGYDERALDLAYRLYVQHRDLPRAWMTFSSLFLNEGEGHQEIPTKWDTTHIEANAAIDLAFEDETELFFVIEPDTSLRRHDADSWEPNHAIVRAVWGLEEGQAFVLSDGRTGSVTRIRHKYVARLQQIMTFYETRFPEIAGFKKIFVEEGPGGFDAMKAQLKSIDDWVAEETDRYLNGHILLSIFAKRIGVDAIDAAEGLLLGGFKLKVAQGVVAERAAADRAIRRNDRRGCVLDLPSLWTAWRADILDIIVATCGTVHLPQSVLDRLRVRRGRLDPRRGHERISASLEGGEIRVGRTSPEAIAANRLEADKVISWIENNAKVLPIIANDDLPMELRQNLRLGRSDSFDAIIVARRQKILLVSDDLVTRQIDLAMGGDGGAWQHSVLWAALERRLIDLATFVLRTADLVRAGHNYLGISGMALAQAAYLDAASGAVPGITTRTLGELIGGSVADPNSHIGAVIGCLGLLWNDDETAGTREPVTGYFLGRLISGRTHDYRVILQTVLTVSRNIPGLTRYVLSWIRGHFLIL